MIRKQPKATARRARPQAGNRRVVTVATLPAARSAGRAWAEDRRRTGSTWSCFLLDDALGVVDAGLPEATRRELGHEICEAATEAWRS